MSPPCCPVCRKPRATSGACTHCGSTDRTAALSNPGATAPPARGAAAAASERLGQYRVVSELGRGGMGRVLEAVDEPLGRRVAVKTLLMPPSDKDVRCQRFLEEARIAGRLEHPGIAPVYNLGRAADGNLYFSMKLVSGRNLEEILKDRQSGNRAVLREYTLSRLLSLFERIVETVAYAHSQGVLHRDLKPANVMIGAHGEVWVLDWGLAKTLGKKEPTPVQPVAAAPPPAGANADLTVAGSLVGTPQYMAPEQAKGTALDLRTDVFGLGGILYKVLTGQAPNQGPDYMGTVMNAALGEIVPVRSCAGGRRAPAALAAIAMKCLATKPEDRYASADELLSDLRAYLAGEAVKAHAEGTLGRLLRLAIKHRRAAIFCGSLAVLLLVGWTLAATVIAAKDRQALAAERQAKDAELARQAAVAESAARAQKRMRAFTPYAEATDLLMRGQLYDRAAKLLEEATQIDGEFPEAQFALGEAYRLAGQPNRAAPAYLHANELSQKITGRPHLQALLAAGMTYDGAGDYKAAESAFVQAEREGANQPLALVGKAFRLGTARHLKEAQAAADEALRQAPHLWETHFASGWVLEEQVNLGMVPAEPNLTRATGLMRKSLELSPRQAEVVTWLAFSLARTGTPANRSDALRLFEQAVALEPQNGNRYAVRGLIRLETGDASGAEADARKARELGAGRFQLLSTDAIVAAGRGDGETAYRLFGQLIKEKQAQPAVIGNWVALGFSLRRDSEVRGPFEEWSRAHADYPEVYVLRAQVKARDGDLAGAVAEDRAGLKIGPYNHKLRGQLALHLYLSRNLQEAMTAVKSVLEVAPSDFQAHVIRVRCLAETGKGGEAKTALDALQKDFPTRSREVDELRRTLASILPK
jgi:serine/threonine protein kinase/Tfp pilus assembly protein PilF